MNLIRNVTQDLETVASCLEFQEIPPERIDNIDSDEEYKDHIKFTNIGDQWNTEPGCWSYLGHQGGEQVKTPENIFECLAKYFKIFKYSR